MSHRDPVSTALLDSLITPATLAERLGLTERTLSEKRITGTRLLAGFSDVVAQLQGIANIGVQLSQKNGGEFSSRDAVGPAFQRFLAAKSRVLLVLGALGTRSDEAEAVLAVANNLAAGVLQADEFWTMTRSRNQAGSLLDGVVLSWSPSDTERKVLEQSIYFAELAVALGEVVPEPLRSLRNRDREFARNVLRDPLDTRSVYGLSASYLRQTSRLLDDFTRHVVEPLLESFVKASASKTTCVVSVFGRRSPAHGMPWGSVRWLTASCDASYLDHPHIRLRLPYAVVSAAPRMVQVDPIVN